MGGGGNIIKYFPSSGLSITVPGELRAYRKV
jgi:hypothetical protein